MVKEFHPINLENGIVKLILKILSISKVIDSPISPSQTAFVKERLIFESQITTSKILS